MKRERLSEFIELIEGDCRAGMATMPAESVDSIVTDPPYGLSFMGKGWDHGVPGVEFWAEALRVLKPGGHLLAFGGTRTVHRLTCAIEDAGFEIRDSILWLYGSRHYVEQQLDPIKLGERIWRVLKKPDQANLSQSLVKGASYE